MLHISLGRLESGLLGFEFPLILGDLLLFWKVFGIKT